jgi:peptide/nickel transport system permease protein
VKFLLQRIGFYSVALWVAATANYLLPRLTGQSPADAIIARDRTFYSQNPYQIQLLYQQYGRPGVHIGQIVHNYPSYLWHMLTLNFGTSVSSYNQPVIDVIRGTLPYSVFIGGTSLILSATIGTFLGMLCAWNRNGKVDTVAPSFFISIGAFPANFAGFLAVYFLAVGYGPLHAQWFPPGNTYDSQIVPGWTWEFVSSVVRHSELPILVLTITGIGFWLLIMRNVMINNVDEDYITMGRAKGVRNWRLMTWYAGRNSILPTMTAFSGGLGATVAGVFLVEFVFNYKGMAYTLLQASIGGDFPLEQACLLMIVVCVLGANFIMDSIYVFLDPRTRVS